MWSEGNDIRWCNVDGKYVDDIGSVGDGDGDG